MDCPICKSKNKIKNGIIKGVQRYKCKDCGRNYTVAHKSTAKLPSERRLGLMMYLEDELPEEKIEKQEHFFSRK